MKECYIKNVKQFLFFLIIYTFTSNIYAVPSQKSNKSIVIFYLEVIQKEIIPTYEISDNVTLFMHFGETYSKMRNLEKGWQVKKSHLSVKVLEYINADSYYTIKDKKNYGKIKYGDGHIVYLLNVPAGSFHLKRIYLSKNRSVKLDVKKIDISPSSVVFLGSYRILLGNYIEERYGPDGKYEIFIHEHGPTYRPIMNLGQLSEQIILEKILNKSKGTLKELLEQRLASIEEQNNSSIENINTKIKENPDSLLTDCVEMLGTEGNLKKLTFTEEILDWYGDISVDYLSKVFNNKNEKDPQNLNKRLNAIVLLGKIGSKAAIQQLKELIKDQTLNDEEKIEAENSLKKLEEPRIFEKIYSYKFFTKFDDKLFSNHSYRLSDYKEKPIEFLLKALDAYNYEVRLDALASLLENNYIIETSKIIKFLNDEHEEIRLNVIAILALYRDKNSIDAIINALNDSSHLVRLNSIWALKIFSNSSVIGTLENVINDQNSLVRDAATEVISFFE